MSDRFEFERLAIADVILVKPKVFGDARGFFCETYRKSDFEAAGITEDFVQDNHSRSGSKILRGLHFQLTGQAKLVRASVGRIFDVAVDVRPSSSTFRQWVGAELSDDNMHQLYVPAGFAHGFVVLGDGADVTYKVGPTYYQDDTERGIRWDDPDIGVDWPVADPRTSDRDSGAPTLGEIADELSHW